MNCKTEGGQGKASNGEGLRKLRSASTKAFCGLMKTRERFVAQQEEGGGESGKKKTRQDRCPGENCIDSPAKGLSSE